MARKVSPSHSVNVYALDGSVKREVPLPEGFRAELRPDLIRKAVNAARANRRQPYGAAPRAGRMHSTESWGPGSGVSRIPRLRGGRSAAGVPPAVGGPRAHPPKAEKDWSEKINRKEARKALSAALAAVSSPELVKARGHRFKEGLSLPLVVEDALEEIEGTQALGAALEALGVGEDLVRAKEGKQQRPGKGKLRGRRYKVPRSLLIVAPGGTPVWRAARNLLGVDLANPQQLSTEALAPGGHAGRLTLFTEKALQALDARLSAKLAASPPSALAREARP